MDRRRSSVRCGRAPADADDVNPSGYHRFDLARPADADRARRLFAMRAGGAGGAGAGGAAGGVAGVRLRMERLGGLRVSLAEDAPVPPATAGVLEVDAILVTPPLAVRAPRARTHPRTRARARIRTQPDTRAHTHPHTRALPRAHRHTQTQKHARAHVHTLTRTRTSSCARAHTHTHIPREGWGDAGLRRRAGSVGRARSRARWTRGTSGSWPACSTPPPATPPASPFSARPAPLPRPAARPAPPSRQCVCAGTHIGPAGAQRPLAPPSSPEVPGSSPAAVGTDCRRAVCGPCPLEGGGRPV
jgi:hypothetical protein